VRALPALLFALVTSLLFLAPRAARAEGSEPVSVAELPWTDGPAPLALAHGVRIELPRGHRFLGVPQAGELMTKLGNLHNDNLLGVVVSADPEQQYLVSIRYDGEGYVEDDEKLDAKELLASLREGEAEYNEERRKLGFPPIHADGWQEEPRYDEAQHHVVWALVVSSERGTSVNLNTRVLGRRGFVSVNLITERDELAAHRDHGVAILRATSFASGERYEDFDATKDKVAEYGLTGLVVGAGVAKAVKVGLFAKAWKGILALVIAGKKLIVALLAGALALAKRLFGRERASRTRDDSRPELPPASSS
jgi:uncharacterized membrane-anchored protein